MVPPQGSGKFKQEDNKFEPSPGPFNDVGKPCLKSVNQPSISHQPVTRYVAQSKSPGFSSWYQTKQRTWKSRLNQIRSTSCGVNALKMSFSFCFSFPVLYAFAVHWFQLRCPLVHPAVLHSRHGLCSGGRTTGIQRFTLMNKALPSLPFIKWLFFFKALFFSVNETQKPASATKKKL